MITKNKIEIYMSYDGDVDLFARSRNSQIKMSDDEWNLIDRLYSRMIIIQSNKASRSFIDETQAQLKSYFENDETIQYFAKIVKNKK